MPLKISTKIQKAISNTDVACAYSKGNNRIIKSPMSSSKVHEVLMNQKIGNSNHSSKSNAHQPSTFQRIRSSNHPVRIVKGQKCTFAYPNGSIPDRIVFALGWDKTISDCDLDVSAFMLDQSGKVPSDNWFIFYGQDKSPDHSVLYKSNKDYPSSPDDAEIIISLNRVAPNINRITICVTIYEALSNGYDFNSVSNFYARIKDNNDSELLYQEITDVGNVTSLIVGELYRYKDSWKYSNVSSGYHRELAQFCTLYGVELE